MKAPAAEVLEFLAWTERHKMWRTFYIDEAEAEDAYDESSLSVLPPAELVSLTGCLCLLRGEDVQQDTLWTLDGVKIKARNLPSMAELFRAWKKKQSEIRVVVTVFSAADLLELETWAGTKGWKVRK